MKKFVKIISVTLCFILAVSLFPASAFAANGARYELPFEPNAEAYLLMSLDTGEVIFEKNSTERIYPASLTKLLTVYTVYQYVDDIDGTMVKAPRYIFDELYGHNSSTADIRQGQVMSVKDLIICCMLPSANEAASILADYVGEGSIANFCMMMNNEAKKLGCTDTHFSTAHGLFTDNHYSTAHDLYLIARACLDLPGFTDIVSMTSYTLPYTHPNAAAYPSGWNIFNTNKMLSRTSEVYRPYVKGIKTGTLDNYSNIITLCKQDGESYICVVIGAQVTTNAPAQVTTAEIMDYFFANYSVRAANTLDFPVTDVPLKYSSDTDTLLLYAESEVMAILPNTADETSFAKVYNLPESVSAPVKAGDAIGTVDYYLAGTLVGTSRLVSRTDADRNIILFLIGKINERLSSLYLKVVVAVCVVMLILYGVYTYTKVKKHDKMQKVRRRR